jgi:hypothetical protein
MKELLNSGAKCAKMGEQMFKKSQQYVMSDDLVQSFVQNRSVKDGAS